MAINPEIKDKVKVGEEWIDDYFLTSEKNQELKDLRTDLTTTQTNLSNEIDRAKEKESDLDDKKADKDFTEKVLIEVKHTAKSDGVHLTKTKVSPSNKEETTEEVILPNATQSTAGFTSPRDKFVIDDAIIKNSDNSIIDTQIIKSDLGIDNTFKLKTKDNNGVERTAINQTTQMEFGDADVHTHINTNGDSNNHITVTTPVKEETLAYESDVKTEKDRAEAREKELQDDIDSNSSRIESLEGRSIRYAVDIPDNATQSELQNIFETAANLPAGTKASDGTRLVDVNKNIVYTYFETDDTWHGPESDTVSTASNDRLGIVKGNASIIYKIRVDSTNGEMTLNTNDGTRDKVLSDNNFTDAQVKKLADVDDSILNLTKDQIGLVDDVLVDGESVLDNKVAKIVNATQTKAGSMSKEDKTKLDGIETGAQVNVIESITANGQSVTITDKNVTLPVPDLAKESESVTNQNSTNPVKYWSGTKAEWDAAVADGTITDDTTWDITDDMVDPINIEDNLRDTSTAVPTSHAVVKAMNDLTLGEIQGIVNQNDPTQTLKLWSGDKTSYDAESQLRSIDPNTISIVEDIDSINIYKNGKSIKSSGSISEVDTSNLVKIQETTDTNIDTYIERTPDGIDIGANNALLEVHENKAQLSLYDQNAYLQIEKNNDKTILDVNNGTSNIKLSDSLSITKGDSNSGSGLVLTDDYEKGATLSYKSADSVNSIKVGSNGIDLSTSMSDDGTPNKVRINGKQVATTSDILSPGYEAIEEKYNDGTTDKTILKQKDIMGTSEVDSLGTTNINYVTNGKVTQSDYTGSNTVKTPTNMIHMVRDLHDDSYVELTKDKIDFKIEESENEKEKISLSKQDGFLYKGTCFNASNIGQDPNDSTTYIVSSLASNGEGAIVQSLSGSSSDGNVFENFNPTAGSIISADSDALYLTNISGAGEVGISATEAEISIFTNKYDATSSSNNVQNTLKISDKVYINGKEVATMDKVTSSSKSFTNDDNGNTTHEFNIDKTDSSGNHMIILKAEGDNSEGETYTSEVQVNPAMIGIHQGLETDSYKSDSVLMHMNSNFYLRSYKQDKVTHEFDYDNVITSNSQNGIDIYTKNNAGVRIDNKQIATVDQCGGDENIPSKLVSISFNDLDPTNSSGIPDCLLNYGVYNFILPSRMNEDNFKTALINRYTNNSEDLVLGLALQSTQGNVYDDQNIDSNTGSNVPSALINLALLGYLLNPNTGWNYIASCSDYASLPPLELTLSYEDTYSLFYQGWAPNNYDEIKTASGSVRFRRWKLNPSSDNGYTEAKNGLFIEYNIHGSSTYASIPYWEPEGFDFNTLLKFSYEYQQQRIILDNKESITTINTSITNLTDNKKDKTSITTESSSTVSTLSNKYYKKININSNKTFTITIPEASKTNTDEYPFEITIGNTTPKIVITDGTTSTGLNTSSIKLPEGFIFSKYHKYIAKAFNGNVIIEGTYDNFGYQGLYGQWISDDGVYFKFKNDLTFEYKQGDTTLSGTYDCTDGSVISLTWKESTTNPEVIAYQSSTNTLVFNSQTYSK